MYGYIRVDCRVEFYTSVLIIDEMSPLRLFRMSDKFELTSRLSGIVINLEPRYLRSRLETYLLELFMEDCLLMEIIIVLYNESRFHHGQTTLSCSGT